MQNVDELVEKSNARIRRSHLPRKRGGDAARRMHGTIATLALFATAGIATAQGNWTNPAGGAWENPANWNGGVPNGAAEFNLATGLPYTVTLNSTQFDEIGVDNSQVSIVAGAGDQLASGATIIVNASAGQISSFAFTGTSVDGTDGSNLHFHNGNLSNMPGSIGGAGATFFTLNNTSFTSNGDPYTFGTGSTSVFTNSAVNGSLNIAGVASFNSSIGTAFGDHVAGSNAPATMNLRSDSAITLSGFLTLGSATFPVAGKNTGIVNVNDSQISLAGVATQVIVGAASGIGILDLTNDGRISSQQFFVGGLVPFYSGPLGTGSMTVAGSGSYVVASQAVAIGSTGTLQVSSGGLVTTPALNLSTGSTLAIALDESGIQVSGLALLAGTLDVTLGSTADPTLGQSFDLLTFGSESGSFSSISLPPLDPGLGWSTQQLYSNGSISVIAVPEPASLSILAIGGIALLSRRKKV